MLDEILLFSKEMLTLNHDSLKGQVTLVRIVAREATFATPDKQQAFFDSIQDPPEKKQPI